MRLFSKIENSKDITDKEYVDALISGKANLSGGNTFTGTQTLNNPSSGGYSINATGYIKGSWLQASATSNKGANTGKVCVFDDAGWIYYRTPKEVIIDAECAVKYEVKKTIDFGNSGALYIGKFKVYDTNVTCEVTSTTSITYSGKLVIATQNYVIMQMTVYGDAANTVAPNFFIKPSSNSDPYIEVYFKPTAWSKNVVHIYGSAIAAEPTNVCTNVSAVPSTATAKPTNALDNVSKHGYTQLTNEDLNTIIEPGWYRAAANNTCTNKPSGINTDAFILEIEKSPDAYIRQTLRSPVNYYGFYIRWSLNSGSSWAGWEFQQTMSNYYSQTFSGRKTFSGGINLTASLQLNGSPGTSGQVLTSTGTGTPQWTTLDSGSVTHYEVNYTGDDTHLLISADENARYSFVGSINAVIDMGITIGGHTIAISADENANTLIYIDAMQYAGDTRYIYIKIKNTTTNITETFLDTNFNTALEMYLDIGSSYELDGWVIKI